MEGWVTILISLGSLAVAVWQADISKKQLEEAKKTKGETEKVLDKINEKVLEIEKISKETRDNVKEQISKLIEKQDENIKTLLDAPHKSEQNQMMTQIFTAALSNPETLKTLAEIGNNSSKSK